MLRRVGASAEITGDPVRIAAAEKIILPGVGRFDRAMALIEERGLRDVLTRKATRERVPTLGICLGMQLLARRSEEGPAEGLGWIDADVRRFPEKTDLKVPHMGWNTVRSIRTSRLAAGLAPDSRFYFVHSYYVHADREDECVLKADYGVEFDAAIESKNLYGVQFHPEKSHKFGMRVLENFARL